MKCSAWKSWELVNDRPIPNFCPNEAEFLLSNTPHWEDLPYCDSCAYWMMWASERFNLSLDMRPIDSTK